MSEIALYNVLTKLGASADEAERAVIEVASPKEVATKTDIKDMATKADIKDMATKDDIKDMATKDDMKDMATKADVKAGLAELKEALTWRIFIVLGVYTAIVGLMIKFL